MPQITNVKLPTQKSPVITNVKLPKEEEEEGVLKSAGRYAMQGVKALPYALPGVGMANLALNASAGSATQETLQELQDLWGEGRISQQQYDDAVRKVEESAPAVTQTAPTLQNLYRLAENKTGLPFEAKTKGQRGAELFSLGAVGGPEGPLSKILTGGATVSLSEGLQKLGLSPDIADNLALLGATASTNAIDQALRSGKFQPNMQQPQTAAKPNQLVPRNFSPTAPNAPNINPRFAQTIPQAPINPEQAEPYQVAEQVINQLPGQVKIPRAPTEPPKPLLRLPPPEPVKPKPLQRPEKPLAPITPNAPNLPPKQDIDAGAETVKFEDDVGNLVSREKALTPMEGGKDLIPAINDSASKAWKQNRQNYDLAEKLAENKERRFLQPAQWIDEERSKLLKRPYDTLSTFEKNYFNRLTTTLNYLGEIDQDTNRLIPGSEQEVPVSQIINIVKSINGDFSSEFQQGNKQNQYKRLISSLNSGIEKSLQGDANALKSWQNARKFHADVWENLYENPLIQPYRSKNAILSADKLYNRASTNPDVHLSINNILNGNFRPEQSAPGEQLTRSSVINLLDPYIKDPSKIDGLDYRRTIAKLRYLLPRGQTLQIHNAMVERKNLLKSREKELEKAKLAKQHYKKQLQRHKEQVREHAQTIKQMEKKYAEEEKEQKESYKEELKKYQHERELDLDDFKKDLLKAQEEYEKELTKHSERVQTIKKAHEQTLEIKGMTPEKLFSKAHEETFLKELIKTAITRNIDSEVIDNFRKTVAIDIALNGKDELNPQTILNAIADVSKRRVLVECLGKEGVASLQDYAKQLQKLQTLMKKRSEKMEQIDLYKDLPFIKKLKDPKQVIKHLQQVTSGKRLLEGGFALLSELWKEHKSFREPARKINKINKRLLQGKQ